MNSAQAKRLSIIEFLEAQNIRPEKIIRDEHWYKSPYREEKTASFTVNSCKNTWMDFGTGEGGNLLDLVIRMFKENDISKVLRKIEALSFSFRQQLNFNKLGEDHMNFSEPGNTLLNFKIKELNNPALLDYLASRRVDGTIARRYCREVYYQLNGKNYFAIAFKNDSGGYELRNKYFKNCIAPKDFTLIKSNQRLLSIFEGFFDFLSYQQLLKGIEYRKFMADKIQLKFLETITAHSDFLILNSVIHLEKATEIIKQYPKLHLLFDNDKTGKFCVATIEKLQIPFEDLSVSYEGFKDLNEFLVNDDQKQDQSLNRSCGIRL